MKKTYSNVTNIMLDVKTMSDRYDAAIVNIAVQEFDSKGSDRGYYQRIDLQSSMEKNLSVGGDKILRYMRYHKQGREEIASGWMSLERAFLYLDVFLSYRNEKKFQLWAINPKFQISVLKNAYKKCTFKKTNKYEGVYGYHSTGYFKVISFPKLEKFYRMRSYKTFIKNFSTRSLEKSLTYKHRRSSYDECNYQIDNLLHICKKNNVSLIPEDK